MPWYFPWSDSIKKRSCRYLLQRYLGQFLEEKLTLNQLEVDLYNGTGSVTHVSLDVEALNELGEQQNWPIEFVDGFIEKISVSIPWSSLLTHPSSVEVQGLNLVIQPKSRSDCGASSMFESMFSSMTSSIQLAEECLKQTEQSSEQEPTNTVNGVEEFAKTIDSILTRVRLKFVDTVIRLEHLPKKSSTGIAIEMRIKELSYYDEISTEEFSEGNVKPTSAFSVKIFSFEGVEFYSGEFSNHTICKSLPTEFTSLQDDKTDISERNDYMILVGKLLGKQSIVMKVNQKENVSGPKIDFEINMSSLVMFFSPRQLRTFCEVICGLMSPHLQDTSNVVSRSRCHQKPMTPSDYVRIEEKLNENLLNPPNSDTNTFMSVGLHANFGWSDGGIGEESDDDFHPVRGHPDSLSSSVTNSTSSSYSGSVSGYHYYNKMYEASATCQSRHHNKHKEKGGSSEPDFYGDISSFQLRLNFLTVILLHQDVLVTEKSSIIPFTSAIEEMKELSKQFFSKYVSLIATISNKNDLHNGKQISQMAVPNRNHFRLHSTTNILNGKEKSNSMNQEICGTLTMANAELVECLMELDGKQNEFVELLSFNRHDSCHSNNASFSQPDVYINFKHFNNSKHFSTPSTTELTINLQDCRSELDITIIDRLIDIIENFNLLLNSFHKSADTPDDNPLDTSVDKILETAKTIEDVLKPTIDNKFDWKVSTCFLTLKMRFPVPDLRTEIENNKSHWHKRDVYSDILFFEFNETTVRNIKGDALSQNYEVQCKSARVLFQEANTEQPIPFIFSETDEKYGMSLQNDGLEWPRLVLKLYPKDRYIELGQGIDHIDEMNQSFMQTQKQEPSPFTNKMIMRESDTSHTKSSANSDAEEIILPGSKEEIGEFIDDACRNALIQVEITLPSVTIQIPSKHFYEVIYNRFSNDLMLWTPRSSKSNFENFSDSNCDLSLNSNMFFSICNSAMRDNSDSEEEDNLNENLLYPDEKASQSQKKRATGQHQSDFTLSLSATRGVLDVFPHARESSGKVIPGQFGEIQLIFNEANLFLVSGYKAESLLNYICLQINHISLYHCSLIPGNCEFGLKSVDSYPSKHVLPTMYGTSAGAVINENSPPVGVGSDASDDMLTLAVRVQGQENRVKNICVANSLNGVTIRHRMKQPYTSWLSQLVDFFDILDYPVTHYQPWKVITALHQQLLNCVVDYRPINLPLRAALTVENFNISSNITTKTSTSILRFIAEEASLFISNKNCVKGDQPDDLSIDLRNDYVCVIDLGLFELSLRLTDTGEGEPQTDLRASNNIVHIRTCADSAIALMDLVKYVASDGDLVDTNVTDEYGVTKKQNNEDVLVNLKGERVVENLDKTPRMNRGNSESSEEGVHQLVEEAINDTCIIQPSNKRKSVQTKDDPRNVELFLFPDEDNMSVSSGSQTYADSQSSDDDLEAEFYVVNNEVGMGYPGGSKIPEVRLLTNDAIRVVDNHFSVPVSKVDDLKAPKSYPNAVSKYTLREMTVVWHMYGGHDFAKSKPEESPTAKKQVTIVSEKGSNTDLRRLSRNSSVDSINVTYLAKSNELPGVNFIIPRPSPCLSDNFLNDSPTVLYERQKNLSWQAQGGANRQHDSLMELRLTKLKYQYEIYPKDTKHASRQILLVQEVEIRDRMASSNMNKFLYLYSSSTRPKQSHANMVVIKATNIRPEPNIHHYQECCLRVSLLPLRLNIDQDSLLFLINFFSEISGGSRAEENSAVTNASSSVKAQMPPVMNIENINPSESSSLMVQIDEQTSDIPAPATSPVFIRSFIFSPEVPIRLDYEGKRVDMTHGPLAGLIMGLGQLNCSELRLKRLCNRHGILGIDKLISYVLAEWLQDIKKNQLPSILGGVGPMYSLVQLFQGIRDLFWLPIEQYQKDGRIIRGLQRGANSFSTSTAMAALELTARIVYAIQRIAETAFDIVSPGPSIRQLRYYDRNGKGDPRNRRHLKSQPADIREGVAKALSLFKEGLNETAQTLYHAATTEHEVKGTVGMVGGVIRQIPSTAISPVIIVTQVASNILDGAKSQLQPDARSEAESKYRNEKTDFR